MLSGNVHGQSETILLTHQWTAVGRRSCCSDAGADQTTCFAPPCHPAQDIGAALNVFFSPIKQVKRWPTDGQLRVVWWPGNEKLKAAAVQGGLQTHTGLAHDLSGGLIIEATLDCSSATTAGFVVSASAVKDVNGTAFIWDCKEQRFLIGSYLNTSGEPVFVPVQAQFGNRSATMDGWDRRPGFEQEGTVQLRLLVRRYASSKAFFSQSISPTL